MIKILQFFEKIPVRIVEYLRKPKGVYVYHIEMVGVLIVLVTVAIISKGGYVEWIGVLAVWMTFGHVSVADRLAEAQQYKKQMTGKAEIACYHKLKKYYYAKETLWFAYFILLGAWSALVGVVVFLLYGPWRKLWRKYHPYVPETGPDTPKNKKEN